MTEIDALDVALILGSLLVTFGVGAWFGWEACRRAHERTHVSRRG